ncbi:MAG: hypothetical protein BWX44_00593 [Spirochaetes bacterium ADurb.Bin001]|nr:MAG: hypothetical protein BWX44_00593 [Spirochaetes bacterium ADurb.Bin001]
MRLLAGEAVEVQVRQRAGHRQDVPERLVHVPRHHRLLLVDQARHVPVPVGVVKEVRSGE